VLNNLLLRNTAGDEELERQLLEEMQQLRGLSNGDVKTAKESRASAVSVDDNNLKESFSLSETAKQGLEKVLIADFFFVLFSLGWLATGLMTKAAFGSTVSCQNGVLIK
jgi:hypothetical protein